MAGSFVGVLSKNPSSYFWPINVFAPATRLAGANGASIDRYRNGGYAALSLQLLAGTWTDGNHSFVIQESSDNATWTTVNVGDLLAGPGAGAGVFNAITSAPTAVNQVLDYIGRLRYVRVVSTDSGVTGAAYAVVGLLFAPAIYPAA